ncbi:MAG: hypothetical protein SGI88_11225 [Candidatus Hydrogenedentes bacterium]|nr:hypothetical protein [Candidatus Hydrogenedentota bacterium]
MDKFPQKYYGVVRNGFIEILGGCPWPDGTEVVVKVLTDDAIAQNPTWAEVFKEVTGKAEGLPVDYSENHDHYLHGHPKKTPKEDD